MPRKKLQRFQRHESKAGRNADMLECRRLAREGHNFTEIATIMGRTVKFVKRHCADIEEQNKFKELHAPRKFVTNSFLPQDDDANVKRYWVPSPDEIERMKLEIRLRNEQGRYVMGSNEDPEDERYSDDEELGEERTYCIEYEVPPTRAIYTCTLPAKSRTQAISNFRLQGLYNAHIRKVNEVKET